MSRGRKLPDKLLSLLFFLLFLLALPAVSEGAVLYVKNGGTGAGSSWAAARGDLQAALAAAISGDEIWVAEGSYKPHESDRAVSFELKDGVALYGGFDGTETALEQRDTAAHTTILTGDIGTPDNHSDNSCHVVSADGSDGTAVLDGFSITGGNANIEGHFNGGGMFNTDSSPTVTNCTFSGNTAAVYGGGMYNQNSSPTVTNSTFSGNTASGNGGGMYNLSSSPEVTNCTFSENTASYFGGGMYNEDSSPDVTNSTFSGNTAGYVGGGMYNKDSSSPEVTNCTFSENTAGYVGGGMYNKDSSSPTVTNCTFSGNRAIDSGGGMFNENSSPTVTNCTFSGNSATGSGGYGGGMYNWNSSPTVTNCTFSGNSATGSSGYGGGMYNINSSSPAMTNCTFSGNTAGMYGGGMNNLNSSSPTVTNCTFSGNTAVYGGGMYNKDSSSPTVMNSIFWGSSGGETVDDGTSAPSLISCVVQGGYPGGTDILEGDPKLGQQLADNGGPTQTHVLLAGSSALDAGRPVGTVVSGSVTVPAADQRGISRPRGAGVDIGACEMVIGGVQVIILPEAARTAGGKWSMDGGTTWKNSGETAENLLPGSYAVTFSDVTGWTKPAARTVDVAQGPVVPVTGTYVQQNPDPDPSPDPAPDNRGGGGCSAGGVFSPSVLLLLAPLALLAVGRTR
jgi:parallel beta-helix repeat protein